MRIFEDSAESADSLRTVISSPNPQNPQKSAKIRNLRPKIFLRILLRNDRKKKKLAIAEQFAFDPQSFFKCPTK